MVSHACSNNTNAYFFDRGDTIQRVYSYKFRFASLWISQYLLVQSRTGANRLCSVLFNISTSLGHASSHVYISSEMCVSSVRTLESWTTWACTCTCTFHFVEEVGTIGPHGLVHVRFIRNVPPDSLDVELSNHEWKNDCLRHIIRTHLGD